ncbi:MAG: hypothetical protein JXR37_26950 [Kiritimatiellae bacterium]|nr:hypothetical protein [Kiritimatiellia bacterium]
MNVKMTGNRKPMRPYYMPTLHGGGGGSHRWWKGQPIAHEEMRAMAAMCLFTGVDGLDLWCWSGTGTHHRPEFKAGNRLMLADAFTPRAADGRTEPFRRYDVIHVLGSEKPTQTVRFQKIRTGSKELGIGEAHPEFAMPRAELARHIRPKSAPVAGMIEGLALVKPLEYIVRHGEVKIDVPAQQQFGKRLPVVRRVKLGPLHVLVTFDPNAVYGTRPKDEQTPSPNGRPREIVLENFDGVAGRTLRLPADAQTRVFVLYEQ